MVLGGVERWRRTDEVFLLKGLLKWGQFRQSLDLILRGKVVEGIADLVGGRKPGLKERKTGVKKKRHEQEWVREGNSGQPEG